MVKNQLIVLNRSVESIINSATEHEKISLISNNVPLVSSDFSPSNSNADDSNHSVNNQFIESMSCVLNSFESFVEPCSDESDESIVNYELGNSKNNYNFNEVSNETIFEKLQKWSIEFKINYNALQGLLFILRETPTFQNLPKDPRTFLMTPKSTNLRIVKPGLYYHFGILNSLNNIFNKQLSIPSTIKLAINIDGLPLSNSSGSQLYPILEIVKDFKPLNNIVFPIGIYHG